MSRTSKDPFSLSGLSLALSCILSSPLIVALLSLENFFETIFLFNLFIPTPICCSIVIKFNLTAIQYFIALIYSFFIIKLSHFKLVILNYKWKIKGIILECQVLINGEKTLYKSLQKLSNCFINQCWTTRFDPWYLRLFFYFHKNRKINQ